MLQHDDLVAILERFFSERFAGLPIAPASNLRTRFDIVPSRWRSFASEINTLPVIIDRGLHVSPAAMDASSSIDDIALALLQSGSRPRFPIDPAPPGRDRWIDKSPIDNAEPADTSHTWSVPDIDDSVVGSPRSGNRPLRERLRNLTDYFKLPDLRLPGASKPAPSPPPQPLPPTFADQDDRQTEVCLIDPDSNRQWDHNIPIYFGKVWAVTVAIRPRDEIGGIPTAGDPKPIEMPRLDRPVDLMVKLTDSSLGGIALAISEPFQTLTLPPHGSSTPCTISFTPIDKRISSEVPAQGRLTVQIYYRLNLIDAIDVEFTLVAFKPSIAIPTPAPQPTPAHLIRYRDETEQDARAIGWLGDDVAPRSMTISVRSDDNRIALDFTIARSGAAAIQLTATSFVSHDDLNALLMDVRVAYTRLILDSFASDVAGDPTRCQRALDSLAILGRRAWALLLNNNAADDSLVAINTYLRGLQLAPASIIQIVLRDTIADLIFPWALLYDGPEPSADQPASWSGFWGARYQIEQMVRRANLIGPLPQTAINYTFLAWNGFAEAADVRQYLADDFAPPRDAFAGELTSDAGLVTAIKADKINFYCFFCHGHTRAPLDGPFKAFVEKQQQVLSDVESALALVGADAQPQRTALQQHIVSTRELLRSSLAIPDHQINLSDAIIPYQWLAGQIRDVRLTTQPVFFLNMCQSAQFFPGISDNFVGLFLKIRAATVIGTECEISPALGEAFGRFLVDALRRGRTTGEAVLDARQALFKTHNNPLGLVYSLYGQASRSLVPTADP